MDELRPLRVFLEVAAQSSFAGAARSLGLTPASVTRLVAKLEQDLGQQLLVRTTRQVSLTSAGALVVARYRPLVREFDATTAEITRATLPDRGRLAINAPVSMGVRLLPGLIDRFRVAYPFIKVDVKMTDTLVDVIEEDCDLAIRISGPPSGSSTIWRKICQVPRHIIAAPALLDRIGRPERPEDVPVMQCLSYSANRQAETWDLSKGALRRGLRAGTDVMSNNGDFLYEIVQAGGGMAVLPDFITAKGLASGAVEHVLPDWDVQPLWLTLYYPPYEQLPPLVATFSDFFEAYLQELDGFG